MAHERLTIRDLVEDDDGSGTVVLLEPVDEFVMRRRLPVDADGRAEVVEDLIERPESSVVAPAVDVGGLDVEHFLAEPFGDELRDADLTGVAGYSDDDGVDRFPICDWFEGVGEVIDFCVAMLDFLSDESGSEDANIVDYFFVTDWF